MDMGSGSVGFELEMRSRHARDARGLGHSSLPVRIGRPRKSQILFVCQPQTLSTTFPASSADRLMQFAAGIGRGSLANLDYRTNLTLVRHYRSAAAKWTPGPRGRPGTTRRLRSEVVLVHTRTSCAKVEPQKWRCSGATVCVSTLSKSVSGPI